MARYITTQRYDTVLYDGKASILVTSPLESHPDREVLARLDGLVWRTPRIRRGYIASWTISDGKVFLTGIQVRTGERGRYTRRKPKLQTLPLTRIFPDVTSSIHATWIDGVLLVGETRGLLERLGLPTTFSVEAILVVNCGVVESTLALQTMPSVSVIGRSMGAALRRVWGRICNAIPTFSTKITKLRLRGRNGTRP